MIQNWTNYNSFVRDRVFQHLIDIYNKKIQAQDTYCRIIAEIIEQVHNKAIAIDIYMKQHASNHKELDIYSQVFVEVQKQMQGQVNQLKLSKDNQNNYIYLLQSCKISFIDNQKNIIEFAQKQLLSKQQDIIQAIKQVKQKEQKIEAIKIQSFAYMLSILHEFDNDLIKSKYLQKQTQKSFKFYGAKRKQMNQMLDQITYLQEEGKQKLKEITEIQNQRLSFINQICQKLNNIENSKINFLLKICNYFKHQIKPKDFIVDYKKDISFGEALKPSFQNREFLQHYRKSAYILLNPHPQNQLLIQHRQSLAKKVSNSQIKNNRSAKTYHYDDVSLDFEVGKLGNQGKTDYDGYLQFLQTIRTTLGSSYLSDDQLNNFLSYFNSNLKKKPLRQVFLFYLYELGKVNSSIIGLILKQGKILIEMINLLLTACLKYYDTQSTIKILMLIYHIELPDQVQLFQTIRTHKIWKSFQFWQTSFLESVYEYFQMIIIYYHKSIDQYLSAKGAEQHQNSNWFTNLFKVWKNQPPQKKKKDQVNIAKDFFHQIIQNLTLIYLSNMIVMAVPKWIIQQFKRYILFIYEQLKFKIEYLEEVKRLIDVVNKKNQKELKKLLQNDNVLDKIMSKLIGTSEEQQKKSVPLSRSIAEWIAEK